jgi:hypothetical protein
LLARAQALEVNGPSAIALKHANAKPERIWPAQDARFGERDAVRAQKSGGL